MFAFAALALLAAVGLLSGCRSKPPVSGPAPDPWAWKPKSEDAKHRLEGFRAYLRRSYPRLGLESKNELWDTALEYMQWLGLEVDSQPGTARLEETLTSLVATPEQTASRWLLKGSLQTQSRGAAPVPSAFFGIALLTRTNGQLTLIADSDRGHFSFRGSVSGERLNGQLTFSSGATHLSGKAQGLLTPGRISLQVRGRSGKRAAEAEFVLLR